MTSLLPPPEKVYEAWSAIASGRAKLLETNEDKGEAFIASSDGHKDWRVRWDGDTYFSNDNATFWQGYAGYPVLAVLMLQGRLPYDASMASYLKDVNWNAANKDARGDYALALSRVLKERDITGDLKERMENLVRKTLQKLSQAPVTLKRLIIRKKIADYRPNV